MFFIVVRIGAAFELGLVLLQDASPQMAGWLPLAGSHAAQAGLIFAGVFVAAELVEFVRFVLKRLVERRRRHDKALPAPTGEDGA